MMEFSEEMQQFLIAVIELKHRNRNIPISAYKCLFFTRMDRSIL